MMPILSTLVYCLDGDRVLLMERRKEPNFGLWVGLGGKLEPGESPYECARRELHEEAGLVAKRLRFRGLVTEVSPLPEWQWMLFIYVVTQYDGELLAHNREGRLEWWPVNQVTQLPIPQADAVFFPHVIDLARPFYHAKYIYDSDLILVDTKVYPSEGK
jgi:8-oxo-dGTP diphosphatase